MNMTILVTGGAGYTGSHVCIELLKQGYEVIVVDNFLTSDVNRLFHIQEQAQDKIKFYAMDLGNKELVERIFRENEIEGIIHFAGIKCTGEYTNKPIDYYYTNLTSTLVLCQVMAEHNVKKMLFSSSEGFYEDNGRNTTTFGSAKKMIERILQEIYKVDADWGIKIIRYLKEEDHVYTQNDIHVNDMCKIYIDAFKAIKQGKFETYELEINNKVISTHKIEDYKGY